MLDKHAHFDLLKHWSFCSSFLNNCLRQGWWWQYYHLVCVSVCLSVSKIYLKSCRRILTKFFQGSECRMCEQIFMGIF